MSIDLDAIQARADAATEGPWNTTPYGANVHHSDNGLWVTDLGRGVIADMSMDTGEDWESSTRSNMAFIANARTDVPALLAYARDLEARVRRAWDEGFDRGFYDPLAGSDRDASESPARNPYRVRGEA